MSAGRAAARGAALGIAALPLLTVAELALIHRRGGSPGDLWEVALVAALLLGLLWPLGSLLGAGLGVAAQRLAPRVRQSLLPLAALALLGGLGVAVLWPAALEAPPLRVGLLLAGWGVAWVGLSALGALRGPWGQRWLLGVGGALALWSWVFLAARLPGWSLARGALVQHATLAAPLLRGLQQLEDRDGDGWSAWFGGGDCAPEDPRRSPGASEVAANGVDEDCDGADLPLTPVVELASAQLRRALPRLDRLAWAAAPAAPEAPPAAPPVRPSLLLITLDTVRPDVVGALGASPSMTPRLDALASRGMVFERVWAQGPLTKASVASLLSGRYFSEVDRSTDPWVKLYPENVLLAERLSEAGYRTVGVTSHPYLASHNGYGQGFEVLHNVAREGRERDWQADRVSARAVEEAQRLGADPAPFFLWVHLLDPHHPYVPHPKLRRQAGFPLPGALEHDAGRWERYQAEVFWTDLHLGAVLEAAASLQDARPLVIAVHADHGEGFGEHGYEYHGQALFEDQLRVPLVIAGSGVEAGRCATPVGLLELHATLLEAAGITVEARRGVGAAQSLWPALRGEALEEGPVFAEMVPDGTHSDQKAAVVWPWKVIHSRTHQTWQLYNLQDDPGETSDRYRAEPEVAARLRRVLEAFMQEGLSEVAPR